MDAVGEPLKREIRGAASCTACRGFYREPVLLRCGSSYCRACVARLSPAVCPDCGIAFEPGRLMPNHSLARLVELAQALLEQQEERREAEAGGGTSSERAAAFCKGYKVFICSDCYLPEDDRGHEAVLDTATKEYRFQLQKLLADLKREEKDILMNKTVLEVDFENYVMQVTEAWEKIKTEFQETEDFLERQKTQLLAQVTEMYKEIKMNKNEQLSALSKKLSLIQNIHYEMEAVNMMNIGKIQQRFEEREMIQPGGSLSEMQRKIPGLVDFHMFLLSSMKQFRENVTSGLIQHRGITTTNPDGSDPSVIMEEPQDT